MDAIVDVFGLGHRRGKHAAHRHPREDRRHFAKLTRGAASHSRQADDGGLPRRQTPQGTGENLVITRHAGQR